MDEYRAAKFAYHNSDIPWFSFLVMVVGLTIANVAFDVLPLLLFYYEELRPIDIWDNFNLITARQGF